MTSQQPTMMRKLKNVITTGGQFSWGMLSSPTSFAERLSESIRLPNGAGKVMAKRFRRFSTSGQASSTSEAGCSSCQRASIAAIFEGWWCTMYSPLRCPKKPWTGTSTAAKYNLWLPKIVSGLAQMPRWAILALGCSTSLKLLSGLLVGLFRSHAAREAEIAFLRQQLVILKRSATARLRLSTADRVILVWLYRLCPSVLEAAVVVKP